MADKVKLIVKAANQSVADQYIDCSLDWTVLNLKENLANAFPSNPSVEEQRLIYSGQLMHDNLMLRAVLRHPPSENNNYTIHLVCSPPRHTTQRRTVAPTPTPPSSSSSTSQPITTAATITTTTPTPTTMSQSSTNSTPDVTATVDQSSSNSSDGLRRRVVNSGVDNSGDQHQGMNNYPFPQSYFQAPMTAATADPIQQMAAMQQMYAQYMTAYMQYMQMGGGGSFVMPPETIPLTTATTLPSTSPTSTTTQPPLNNPPGPPPQQPQQQAAPAPPQQQPAQVRMNAQGGDVPDDDDDERRDWLDYVYVASRMAVMLSVVYFYSTLSRFMLVVCTGMMFYLYQGGWFRPMRRVEQPEEVEVQAPVQQQQPPPNDLGNNEVNDDRNNNIQNNNNNNNNHEPGIVAGEDGPIPVVAAADDNVGDNADGVANIIEDQRTSTTEQDLEDIPPRPSILTLSWTFLTTFFTSLIPEQPQII